ncbi:MAG: PAS domain S-box protein, partial [Alphaproteobacteria bacterium]|nr:PAS domain S-box protein [Alphaproteobacteria bacterium]
KNIQLQLLENRNALARSEQRFSMIANKLPLVVWLHGPDGSHEFVNDTFCSYFGVTRDEMKGDRWQLLTHPDSGPAYAKAFAAAIDERQTFRAEVRARDAHGRWRWLESWAEPYFSDNGDYLGHIGASADVTERKVAEEQNILLMREVNHRSKNLLSVVQSIARQTAKDANPGEFAEQFSQRLQGLSASQDLVIDGDWTAVGLVDLVRSQLRHLGEMLNDRVEIRGNQVLITPAAAQGIGMALHELATNALKYGALSDNKGKVLVDWARRGNDGTCYLEFTWQERGGPEVHEPSRNGFGRTVIERMAAYAVGGEVELRYDPNGVSWSLTAPEENILYRHR